MNKDTRGTIIDFHENWLKESLLTHLHVSLFLESCIFMGKVREKLDRGTKV